MDSISTWMFEHGFGDAWTAVSPYVSLIILVAIAIVFFKYVLPHLLDAAANIVWAALTIIVLFLIASFAGIDLPFIAGIQHQVVDWIHGVFSLPSSRGLANCIGPCLDLIG